MNFEALKFVLLVCAFVVVFIPPLRRAAWLVAVGYSGLYLLCVALVAFFG